jgi:hypothetical protein
MLFCAALLLSGGAWAEIFLCVDPGGARTYQSVPCKRGERETRVASRFSDREIWNWLERCRFKLGKQGTREICLKALDSPTGEDQHQQALERTQCDEAAPRERKLVGDTRLPGKRAMQPRAEMGEKLERCREKEAEAELRKDLRVVEQRKAMGKARHGFDRVEIGNPKQEDLSEVRAGRSARPVDIAPDL